MVNQYLEYRALSLLEQNPGLAQGNFRAHGPLADPEPALHEYCITLSHWHQLAKGAEAIITTMSHAAYTSQPVVTLVAQLKRRGVFIDINPAYMHEAIKATGACLWRL
jgi:UDP-N-acetyl-D-glucosamine/UDP-N-acetyl-D-galactosamine dehydrogenase